MNEFPAEFVENVIRTCRAKGELWLSRLPETIEELEDLWTIKTGPHFSNLTYNFVTSAEMKDGSKAVLKIGLPVDDLEIYSEAEFLRIADGRGAVKLLAENRTRRAMLLERLEPGCDLKQVYRGDRSQMVKTAARVLKRTVAEPPSEYEFLIDLRDWFEKLHDSESGEFPAGHMEKTRKIADRQEAIKLIHGDYHHTNVLSRGANDFVVIDPKGVIGDVRYDIGVFLNNHLWYAEPGREHRAEMDEAVREFADQFGCPAASIVEWAFAQVTLSAYWTFTEGGEHWKRQLALADFWNV